MAKKGGKESWVVARAKQNKLTTFLRNCIFRGVEAEGPFTGQKTLFIARDVTIEELRQCLLLAEEEERNIYFGAGFMRRLPKIFLGRTHAKAKSPALIALKLVSEFPFHIQYETTLPQFLFEVAKTPTSLWQHFQIVMTQDVDGLANGDDNDHWIDASKAIAAFKLYDVNTKTTHWWHITNKNRGKGVFITTARSPYYLYDEEVTL